MTVRPPVLVAEVRAVSVERLSPSFVRVELAAPELADLEDGPRFDQRIKLVFPTPGADLPPDLCRTEVDADWFERWRALPQDERGHVRTYTIRAVRGRGPDTRVVVDIVVHDDWLAGPGAAWALAARPGAPLVLVGPRRGVPFGGIEFAPPPSTTSLLLAGDETAVPAVAAILADLPGSSRGTALLEVPEPADIADLAAPRGMELCWLPRRDAGPGARLVPAVRDLCGLGAAGPALTGPVDPDLWETPAYSSSGADLDVSPAPTGAAGLYAWIAGESGTVSALRRALVGELGVARSQVAFMGYWRRGVAMRS